MPIDGLNTFSLQYPESITYRMPSTVSDVSAMLVHTTHFRMPSGVFANTRLYASRAAPTPTCFAAD